VSGKSATRERGRFRWAMADPGRGYASSVMVSIEEIDGR
jgi:hypothetical protein